MSDELTAIIDNELRAKVRRWVTHAPEYETLYGIAGKFTNSRWVVDVPGRPGYSYVTLNDGTCVEAVGTRTAGMPVRLRLMYGEYEIVGTDMARLSAVPGLTPSIIQSGTVGKHHHRVGSGMEYHVPGLLFEPGAVRLWHEDTAFLYIEPFSYQAFGKLKNFPGGTIKWSDYLPTASGTKAWVQVGIDVVTNAPIAQTGTEEGAPDRLPIERLFSDPPLDGLALCAVQLAEGQTSAPTIRDFFDLRAYADSSGVADGTLIEGTVTIPTETVQTWAAPVTVSGDLVVNGRLYVDEYADAFRYELVRVNGITQTPRRAVNLIAGTNVSLTATDDAAANETDINVSVTGSGGSFTGDVLPATFQARLTLSSGTPVPTNNVTAATTLYLTPHRGTILALYDGSSTWTAYALSEISLSLAGLSANTNYDIFVYNASGLTLEAVAWSSNTARATALAVQNGVYVKSGATTRRYAGTIRITGTTGQCEDSARRRFVYNYWQPELRPMRALETADSWSYSAGAWRSYNNASNARLELVVGIAERHARFTASGMVAAAVNGNMGGVGVGIDSTTTNDAQILAASGAAAVIPVHAVCDTQIAIGYHYVQMLEVTNAAPHTFYGDIGGTFWQSGITGDVWQ